MSLYLAAMLGGALGSAARFAMNGWVTAHWGEEFPWGTLVVNVLGAFVIGFLGGLCGPQGALPAPEIVRVFLVVGVLGGFTTFSAFSFQTVVLWQLGAWPAAMGYVVASVVVCLLATAGGLALGAAIPAKG